MQFTDTENKTHTIILLGILLGFGAPLGWALLKSLTDTNFSYIQDIDNNKMLYAYMTIATPIAFGIWAYLLSKQLAAYRRLSIYDSLTGLINRRAICQYLSDHFDLAKRYSYFISVIMIDIDHFKQNINDKYGHLFGDYILKTVSDIIAEKIRRTDIAGRYGGEEFLVVLLHTELEGATLVAENIRSSIEYLDIEKENEKCALTVSLGVASMDNKMQDYESLIKKADENLYIAKRKGRNRVISS